ncbi:MAG: pyrroline-5-carboxylate reductase [Symbiobacteriaceae bacterium]|jgi:pyrroline-5-carboxylate reductase|nr:pyrroline-5-carboxylate reductase [Symbiobacteriaceae bacterium]
MLHGKTIGFLGAGSMAEALMRGLIQGGVVRPQQMIVTNRSNRERLETLQMRYGVRTAASKATLVAEADVLVVLCKPKDVADLLAEIRPYTSRGQVLLSVAAGVSTSLLADGVAPGVRVVRAMPNTSCQVGESATAICLGEGAGEEARLVARAILGAVGRVVEVPEAQLDAVTGLSGSGPAYIYLMIEAMVEAGRGVGLSEQVARELAVQTLLGAARTLVETGEDPAELRQKVTSPGGTTMAGLQVLNEAGFREAMVRAVARATQRSQELGRMVAAPRLATS